MGVVNRLLSLMGKQQEDGGTLCNSSLATHRVLDGLFPKALDCMMLEIGHQELVLQILIALNTTKSGLALLSCTREKVAQAAIMILNRDTIGLEENVYQGVLTPFQSLCNT